jgi:prepilin-type processing-associated H-X9-DG protein
MMRSSLRWLLVCLAVLVPQTCPAGEKALPADLAFVPADAMGFVHVRLADLWKNPHLKEWRQTVLRAGEKALAAFDARFFPAPSSLDRVTLFVLSPGGGQRFSPEPLVIIATSRDINKEGFLKYTFPGAEEVQTPAGTLLISAKLRMAVHFIDARTFVVGPVGNLRSYLARPKTAKGNLSEALAAANNGKILVAALNGEALPPMVLKNVPPPLRPLLSGKSATVTLDLAKEAQIDVRLAYADDEQTAQAEESAKQGIKLARHLIAKGRIELEKKIHGDGKPGFLKDLPEAAVSVVGLGMLNRLDDFLAKCPIKKQGNALTLSLQLPPEATALLGASAIGTALLLPAVQKVREAAARTQSANNLKQMALAMLNFESAQRRFPAAAICDAAGKPLLSWRVAILPYVEQDNLYRQFKLDEPWDSEHNRKLIPLMPAIYALPAAPTKRGETHYRVFVGGGAGFEWRQGPRIAEITDGTSNTIAIVEAAQSVPWTKPDELVYDAKKPLPRMGNFYGAGIFNAAFFDGHVQALRLDLPEAVLRAYITRAGGEVISGD